MASSRSATPTSAGAARRRPGALLALALLAGLPSGPAAAEEEAAGEEPKLQIHGFLSQALAATDGNQILGIPEEGTSDYRTAAVQIRYQMAPRDLFVFQLAHERLGESPLAAFRDDVQAETFELRSSPASRSTATKATAPRTRRCPSRAPPPRPPTAS